MVPGSPCKVLPDLSSALSWASERKRQHIRCSLAMTSESAKSADIAFHSAKGDIDCLRSIATRQLDAALSIKLSAIGAIFNHDLCMEYLLLIAREAARLQVPLEIEMEGKDLVEFTIDATLSCRKVHDRVTLSLQAYLDRTAGDLRSLSARGVSIRLVKGAFSGDSSDFSQIQARFRSLAEKLAASGQQFFAGTHDPDLISYLMERMADSRDRIEFGFFLGFADQTKQVMVAEGWEVSEYIPFGANAEAYISRCRRYCLELEQSGRSPMK